MSRRFKMNNVVLASASPRRKELLGIITENFKIVPSGVEETVPDGILPEKQPEYLASLKALNIAKKNPHDIVIGADTSVIIDNCVLGKPVGREEAKNMLRRLSGRTHKVVTGCAVIKNGECRSFSSVTEVEFYPLTDVEIEEYIATGEPFDKAGAYGIQGKGGLLVKAIRGDWFNVVGLPVAELARTLKVYYS